MVHDAIAKSLEISGLWRRAAGRWLDVLMECKTEEQRDWVRKRRNFCLSNTRREAPEKLDAAGMSRAVSAAIKRMGIETESDKYFRHYPDA